MMNIVRYKKISSDKIAANKKYAEEYAREPWQYCQ